jgi:ABC-type dipeptide/oligopeptide/nickel transport system permease component
MEIILFAAAVALFLAVGIGLGMLVAPRLGRWADTDEEPRDDRPG